MKDPYLQRADEVFAIEMEALEAVRQSLGSSFGQVVASLVGILNQRGKIVVVECKVMRVVIFDMQGRVLVKFSCSR